VHQLTFDSNFFAFGEVFFADFRELAPRHDGVPLDIFYPLALVIGVGRIGRDSIDRRLSARSILHDFEFCS
jgi:hypothetical protein